MYKAFPESFSNEKMIKTFIRNSISRKRLSNTSLYDPIETVEERELEGLVSEFDILLLQDNF